jgi:predicted ATPase/class 3 adenylate cyclase
VANLPTGTVSLLFSDIEGSTALLRRLGPAYAQALDGQRQLLRKAWGDHTGTELGTEGDSFYVVFETAQSAVAAAAQGQRELARFEWPGGEQVRVRMGVHTGSPTVHDGAYVGMDVHRAARIAAAAHGGQVLLSEPTAKLVTEYLPAQTTLKDLGVHQLKDIINPERLFQLGIQGLPTDFPPPKALGTTSSIPRPATPLVGRDGELAKLTALLSSSDIRLVTLTGPGGTGKSRLAVGVVERLVQRFPDGVYFVPLSAVTTPPVMWTTIAEVLGVPPEGRMPPGFFEHVAHRSALFVLDNLEQIDGGDNVVNELLNAANQVVVLATSRRPLHVPYEHEHAVPPLELPVESALESVANAGAVQLFVQHARKVKANFALTPGNSADIAAVCSRLDGLPLAIELAAARSKLLSPAALLTRLDRALDIPAAGRHGPSRHKTLRDTVSWSNDLLDSSSRTFFRQLGVFAGGADLDAVTAVAGHVVGSDDPLELVAELVDSSLATVDDGSDGEPRVRLLETIRAYAVEQLELTAELDAARNRHAEYFLTVAEHIAKLLEGPQYLSGRARFEVEHDNFRAALRYALHDEPIGPTESDRQELAVRLGAALAGFWSAGGYYAEMRRWLEAVVNRSRGRESPHLATCLTELAFNGVMTGDVARGLESASASVAMWRQLEDQHGLPRALGILGEIEVERGNLDAARTLYEEALRIARATGDRRQVMTEMGDLASLEMTEGHYERALEWFRRTAALAKEAGDPVKVVIIQHNLACTLHKMGQFEDAATQMFDQLDEILRLGEPWMLVVFAEDYAATLAELGRDSHAVRLLGAVDAMRDRIGIARPPTQDAYLAEPMTKTRANLTAEEWDRLRETGRAMTVEQALDLPGGETRRSPPTIRSDHLP